MRYLCCCPRLIHWFEGFQRLEVNEDVPPLSQNVPQESLVEYKDITQRFTEEAETLAIGQLVQDPNFTLLEAVGALEIMDPKMDSGLMPAITEEHFNVIASRSAQEIIGIMDQLLSYEMAWHSGNALSQTVLISLYIDKLLESSPVDLNHAIFYTEQPLNQSKHDFVLLNVLRGYCLGVIKSCFLVNNTIKSQYVLEIQEEDFVTTTYNISLLDDVQPAEICQEIENSLQLLDDISHQRLWSEELHTALKYRLSHRLSMLRNFSMSVQDYGAYIDTPLEPWESCLELSKRVEETHPFGKPVEEAFSTNVLRKLATTVPPRPKAEMQFTEAIGDLKRMCAEMTEIVKILQYVSPGNILTFLLRFNGRKLQPCTYVRVMLQCLLVQNWAVVGKVPIKEYVIADLKELCCPLPKLLDPNNDLAEAPQSPEYNIMKRVNWFTDKASNLMLGLFQKLCMNRPRVRRTLCHILLDWDAFQSEAEDVDTELHQYTHEEPLRSGDSETYSYPLSSWVFYYKLRIMEWIVLLGFELEIYQPYEFAGMYWVAQHYIRTRLHHLERIRTHVVHQGNFQVLEEWRKEQQETMAYLMFLSLEASAQHDLIVALTNTHRILLIMDLITTHPQPYGADELRFMLRMKPFQSINVPEPFTWDYVPWTYFQPQKYKEEDEQDLALDKQESIEEAHQSIADARKHYELLNKMRINVSRAVLCEDMYRESLKDVLRSCIATSISLSVLKKSIENGDPRPDSLEIKIESERYHAWFPVPVVGVKKG
ncbi:Mak10 subunit, NatC N-terminal acetyltransferase-domain-containing protein [Kalaharituber pfeilii]|nr:Mak10 subunit, NatC N-terminal acetyltransferase-domain-containing protein [Kalaharituber pfeilii]